MFGWYLFIFTLIAHKKSESRKITIFKDISGSTLTTTAKFRHDKRTGLLNVLLNEKQVYDFHKPGSIGAALIGNSAVSAFWSCKLY